jgi:hypothetical protein
MESYAVIIAENTNYVDFCLNNFSFRFIINFALVENFYCIV